MGSELYFSEQNYLSIRVSYVDVILFEFPYHVHCFIHRRICLIPIVDVDNSSSVIGVLGI